MDQETVDLLITLIKAKGQCNKLYFFSCAACPLLESSGCEHTEKIVNNAKDMLLGVNLNEANKQSS
jgi:hypothetical protein